MVHSIRTRFGALALIALASVGALSCAGDVQTYEARGVVEDVAPDGRWIKIQHDEIPGFMPAMTMNFDVASPEIAADVERGSIIRFALERTSTRLTITEIEVTGGTDPGPADGALLTPLDRAPDFELIDQEGARFRLADTRGKAVLLDFIFTRCPGPCPMLTAAHVELQRALPDVLAPRVQFVSVSIDPEYDTPERMREYGVARGADLTTWSFLTGKPDTVQSVMSAYHVGTRPAKDGTLDHIVATFLIDPVGNITERFIGIDHERDAILRAIERALA